METLRSGPSIVEFARMLPKTETHLHFEGALPIELLREVQPEVDLSSWDADFKFDGFDHFLGDLLQKQAAWFTSVERYHLAARSLFRRHLAETVRYVEVSIASGALEASDLSAREVFAAVGAAVPAGLEVRLFLGIHRDGNTPRMAPVLAECIDWPELAGIDLHGAALACCARERKGDEGARGRARRPGLSVACARATGAGPNRAWTALRRGPGSRGRAGSTRRRSRHVPDQ